MNHQRFQKILIGVEKIFHFRNNLFYFLTFY